MFKVIGVTIRTVVSIWTLARPTLPSLEDEVFTGLGSLLRPSFSLLQLVLAELQSHTSDDITYASPLSLTALNTEAVLTQILLALHLCYLI